MTVKLNKRIHVAVGVVLDDQQQVLISKRPEASHQGGLWEFPGGKVEQGESVEQALVREFAEEVDLTLGHCEALQTINHDYGDKHVLLDVWMCRDFSGEAIGREGQTVRWVALADLQQYPFPEANKVIIEKLKALFDQ